MVPEFIGRKGVEKLRELGYNTEYQTYPIEHSVCMEEIADIAVWLRRVLSLA